MHLLKQIITPSIRYLSGIVFLCLILSPLNAQTLTWDGGDGNWSTSDAMWRDAGNNLVTWSQGANAYFPAENRIFVTPASGIEVGNITHEGTNQLDLIGTGSLQVQSITSSSGKVFISNDLDIVGSGQTLTVTGTGANQNTQVILLRGTKTFSGGTLQMAGSGHVQMEGLLGDDNIIDFQSSTSGVALRTLTHTYKGITGALSGSKIGSRSNNATLRINPQSSESFSFAGNVSSFDATTLSLEKSGDGTQIFTGTMNYDGATTVEQGLLQIDGTLSGSNSVTVQDGGILGGSGEINKDILFQAGSNFLFNPDDHLVTNGDISFEDFGIANLSGLVDHAGLGTYLLFDGTGTIDTTNLNNLGAGQAAALGDGRFAYFETGSLSVTVIPEPGTLTLTVLGLMGAVMFLRKKRA